MAQKAPDHAQIATAIRFAEDMTARSSATRSRWRRRHAPARAQRLTAAREACATAAEPLRSWLGMVAWHNIPLDDELAMKAAMQKLRYERRQIDKMLAAEK